MSREKSPAVPSAPSPHNTKRRNGRSGQGLSSLVAQLNEETRVDQLIHRGRARHAADDERPTDAANGPSRAAEDPRAG